MKSSLPLLPAAAATDLGPTSLRYATKRKQQVILSGEALATMVQHRQLDERDPEAGGMLFAKISSTEILVEEATEPRRSDRRWRFGFWPCTKTQQQVIDARFRAGLHFVGEWHTHPERHPHPSNLDLTSMEKCFLGSQHELKALVMVILGTAPVPAGLWVSLHNQRGYRQLKLMP